MDRIFILVLNMSLTGSYIILCLILARQLLRKAPKILSYALWSVVGFRLIIPFSFESILSFIPKKVNIAPIPSDIIYQQRPQIHTGLETIDTFVNKSLPVETVGASINPLQFYIKIASYIWILGIIVLIIYSVLSLIKLGKQLKHSQLIEGNIYETRNLKIPFVLGLNKAKIYLPKGLSDEEKGYILLHEQIHIRRKDHIIKMLAFLILSIHWFNPLVWLAFALMTIDMELSCDEKVLKEIDKDIKKDYANSLFSFACERHIFNCSPLAFGEVNIRRRIENVLNYRKPKFWVIIVTVIITITLAFSLLGNPIKADKDADNHGKKPYKEEDSIENFIEDSLEKILSSSKESSSPQDYINAHNDEYHDILKRGEHALNYLLGQFEIGNTEGLRGQIMMSLSKELLGERNNVTDNSLAPQDWYRALEIRQEVSISDFKYGGRDPIEKLVYETEMGKGSGVGKGGGFLVVAPVIYGTYEEDDMLKVFTTIYSVTYKLYENTLSEMGGSVIPVAITYKKDGSGNYILDKYEQARDGSDFAPSIREFSTMPKSNKEIKGLAKKILNDYGTSKEMTQLMYRNLYNHLKKHGVTDAVLKDPYGETKFSMKDFK